jgi:hypothetical protein
VPALGLLSIGLSSCWVERGEIRFTSTPFSTISWRGTVFMKANLVELKLAIVLHMVPNLRMCVH